VHGVVEAVLDMLDLPCHVSHRFTPQNSKSMLSSYFCRVDLKRRNDALDLTHLPDLIGYLRSMDSMTVLADLPYSQLLAAFYGHMKDGILSLPKEYGLFICSG